MEILERDGDLRETVDLCPNELPRSMISVENDNGTLDLVPNGAWWAAPELHKELRRRGYKFTAEPEAIRRRWARGEEKIHPAQRESVEDFEEDPIVLIIKSNFPSSDDSDQSESGESSDGGEGSEAWENEENSSLEEEDDDE